MYSEHKLTNFAIELFSFHRYLKFVCVDKLVNHPYFTRSKGLYSFPGQSSDKWKETMGDNNKEISPTYVVMDQPTIAYQNEMIMELIQQIA